MNWRIKALLQKTLARVPYGKSVHYALQRSLGGLRCLNIDHRLRNAMRLVELLAEAGVDITGKTVVEIGSGWAPIVPTYFYLLGAGRCISYDLNRYLKEILIRQMLDQFGVHIDQIVSTRPTQDREIRDRYTNLAATKGVEDVLRILKMDYRAPANACQTGLPDGSVDVLFSNLVLEHVPPSVIEGLFREARRILKPSGGMMVHRVDPGDHYRSFDRTITQINFLRYSHKSWRFWGQNDIHYQNRLRAPQYRQIAERAGFRIVSENSRVDLRSKEALMTFPLDAEFSGFSRDDLCTVTYDFVAKPT